MSSISMAHSPLLVVKENRVMWNNVVNIEIQTIQEKFEGECVECICSHNSSIVKRMKVSNDNIKSSNEGVFRVSVEFDSFETPGLYNVKYTNESGGILASGEFVVEGPDITAKNNSCWWNEQTISFSVKTSCNAKCNWVQVFKYVKSGEPFVEVGKGSYVKPAELITSPSGHMQFSCKIPLSCTPSEPGFYFATLTCDGLNYIGDNLLASATNWFEVIQPKLEFVSKVNTLWQESFTMILEASSIPSRNESINLYNVNNFDTVVASVKVLSQKGMSNKREVTFPGSIVPPGIYFACYMIGKNAVGASKHFQLNGPTLSLSMDSDDGSLEVKCIPSVLNGYVHFAKIGDDNILKHCKNYYQKMNKSTPGVVVFGKESLPTTDGEYQVVYRANEGFFGVGDEFARAGILTVESGKAKVKVSKTVVPLVTQYITPVKPMRSLEDISHSEKLTRINWKRVDKRVGVSPISGRINQFPGSHAPVPERRIGLMADDQGNRLHRMIQKEQWFHVKNFLPTLGKQYTSAVLEWKDEHNHGRNALIAACAQNAPTEVLNSFITYMPSSEYRCEVDRNGMTGLHYLLKEGASASSTKVHTVINGCNDDLHKIMSNLGDIKVPLLHCAIFCQVPLDVMKELLKGSDISSRLLTDENGLNALMFAAKDNAPVDVLRLLLKGMPIDYKSQVVSGISGWWNSKTALWFAQQENASTEVIKLLTPPETSK
eukprot:TRINITY_DN7547_c0_g2_i2.p1 TRINITY_DN7547_c0_g2~~TRINITY_DN7547_c0_g2_i2.p1  ORF type:complete len:715 (+),score=175.91 TRINITY_DN7547_c0_g2_i2:121-2265(+)